MADGEPIVSRAEDGYVQRIPTQRVSFIVNRGPKGEMVAGESFVLFQNGNEQNRFDEDPSYKVGRRHLLFLTPRKDGTYLVVSPEGRYEVTGGDWFRRPTWASPPTSRAPELLDVLRDVKGALEQ